MQIVFVFALLSTLVLSIVLLGIVWVVSFVAFKRTVLDNNISRKVFLFRSQLGQYACSLLLSKWISCLGGLIAIKWVNEGGISTGVKPTCWNIRGALTLVATFRRTLLLRPRYESSIQIAPACSLNHTFTQVPCTRLGSLHLPSSLS